MSEFLNHTPHCVGCYMSSVGSSLSICVLRQVCMFESNHVRQWIGKSGSGGRETRAPEVVLTTSQTPSSCFMPLDALWPLRDPGSTFHEGKLSWRFISVAETLVNDIYHVFLNQGTMLHGFKSREKNVRPSSIM